MARKKVWLRGAGRRTSVIAEINFRIDALEPRLLLSATLAADLPPLDWGDDHAADHVDDLFVDEDGNLIYWDPVPELPREAVSAAAVGAADVSVNVALEQMPLFHSNPSASQKVFLDFDGHTVTGTSWNNKNNGDPIHAPAFDTDGDIFSFNSTELARIEEVWRRVAEDYAPFDVDVTNEDPGVSQFTGGRKGIRVMISTNVDDSRLGGTGNQWYGSAGGVAYVGSWRWGSDTPVWVFENMLSQSAKNIAEASSHEVGHAFGLGHDGNDAGSYYRGHGSGETSWGPIMGASYGRNVTQFSKGEYLNANNTQNDLSIITSSNNNMSYRVDDHGGNAAGATVLDVDPRTLLVDAGGIIERNTDVDVFELQLGDGLLNLSIDPWAPGPNLDIQADLYDAQGQPVLSNNPFSDLDATISTNLFAGFYYLHITGVSKGDPYGTGFADYGSIGQYTISGTAVIETGPPPEVVDFASELVLPYANQDQGGTYSTEDLGATLRLEGNTWKRIAYDYYVTANTVLEFEFFGEVEGEIHGIGLDENNVHGDDQRNIQLHGTQTADAVQDYNNYAGGWQTYTIPVGQYYIGQMHNLFFVNDADAAPHDGVGRFRNVKTYEVPDEPISFNDYNVDSYAVGQDQMGFYVITDAGAGLHLEANTWKSIDLDYQLTPGTVIEFEFRSTVEGEIHGIGFDENGRHGDKLRNFQLYGTQDANAIHDFDTYSGSGDWETFVIPVGQYYTGAMDRMFFINDNDANPVIGMSDFRNVVIREQVMDFGGYDVVAYAGQDVTGTFNLAGQGNAALELTGNTWKAIAQKYTVTPNTVLEFDFSSTSEGEIHGIGFDTDLGNSTAMRFNLFGTQTDNGINVFNDYTLADGTKHYSIPVGEYYTGDFKYLFFVNDKDAGSPVNTSVFSNLRVYEAASEAALPGALPSLAALLATAGDDPDPVLPATSPTDRVLRVLSV